MVLRNADLAGRTVTMHRTAGGFEIRLGDDAVAASTKAYALVGWALAHDACVAHLPNPAWSYLVDDV